MIRGDVWVAELDPVRGSEQPGTRPVIVLQADLLNAALRTVVVVPLTTNLRWSRLPYCARVNAGDGGLPSDSTALCHQVRVADQSRMLRRLGHLSDVTMLQVEQALRVAVGL